MEYYNVLVLFICDCVCMCGDPVYKNADMCGTLLSLFADSESLTFVSW